MTPRTRSMIKRGRAARGTERPHIINEAQARAIFLSEEKGADLARQYNISPAMVSGIKKRTKWAWATENLVQGTQGASPGPGTGVGPTATPR